MALFLALTGERGEGRGGACACVCGGGGPGRACPADWLVGGQVSRMDGGRAGPLCPPEALLCCTGLVWPASTLEGPCMASAGWHTRLVGPHLAASQTGQCVTCLCCSCPVCSPKQPAHFQLRGAHAAAGADNVRAARGAPLWRAGADQGCWQICIVEWQFFTATRVLISLINLLLHWLPGFSVIVVPYATPAPPLLQPRPQTGQLPAAGLAPFRCMAPYCCRYIFLFLVAIESIVVFHIVLWRKKRQQSKARRRRHGLLGSATCSGLAASPADAGCR